ncbi:MAG: energy transducer TonB [Alistipes senegalensis]|nr:energy transducer TonB [Oxalobacter formigenes]MCM1281116.1 energy transducer TonB [Alistipes senegalensis]
MVILAVHILATGQVDNIHLKKSSGYSRLDNAAIATVKKWRYIPARQGNTTIPFWHIQAVRFSLTD